MLVPYVMFMLTFDSMKVTNPLLSAPGPVVLAMYMNRLTPPGKCESST